MSIKALTGLVSEWFTPADEVGKEDATEFNLQPLTTPQMARIQAHFDAATGSISAVGLYTACEFGLKGWRNLLDHEGNDLKFNKRRLDVLPIEIVAEVGGQIIANSVLTDEDEKNS